MRALADIVPILGATTVIGGKRAKLFNDGRPIIHPARNSRRNSRRSSTIPNETSQSTALTEISNLSVELNQILELPERPSPDGEEGETSTELEQSAEDDLDNWEDWDVHEGNNIGANIPITLNDTGRSDNDDYILENTELQHQESSKPLSQHQSKYSSLKKKKLLDIMELDIKNQVDTTVTTNDEFDFFQDMEPVIESSKNYLPSVDLSNSMPIDNNSLSKRLDFGVVEIEKHEEGWGDEIEWD